VVIVFPPIASYRDPIVADLEPMLDDPRLQRLLDKAALRRRLYQALFVLGRGAAAEIEINREGDR